MSNARDGAADDLIVIGVGHAERQDDGVGPYVAAALFRRGMAAVVHQGEGTGLLDLWETKAGCVVVDAVAASGPPGKIHLFTDLESPGFQQAGFVHSTHRLGVPEAVALGRMLGRLPGRLLVVGVTGGCFDFGDTLSPPVAAAADRLIDHLATAEDVFDAALWPSV